MSDRFSFLDYGVSRVLRKFVDNQMYGKTIHYYIDVIIRAYKSKKPLEQLQHYKEAKLRLIHDSALEPLKELFKGKELERLFDYVAEKRTNPHTYKGVCKKSVLIEI